MIDVHSDTWRAVEALLQKEMARATENCMAPNTNERQSDFNRGIAYLSRLVLDFAAGEVAPQTSVIPFD